MEQAPEAILVWDPGAARIVDVNKKAEELFGLDRPRLLGSDPRRFYRHEQSDGVSLDESFAKYGERAMRGEAITFRRVIENSGGKDIPCEVRLTKLPSQGHSLIRASYIDISERHEAEHRIDAALKEKTALLSEVFHRTRNNMQVMMSLLSFQARAAKGEEAASLLQKSIDRIGAMALVQSKLYDAPDLAEIDLAEYLRELVTNLTGSPLFLGRKIVAKVDAGPSPVSIDIAADFGIVFNELVSNAFEHAYPDGIGEVRIGLATLDDGFLELTVSFKFASHGTNGPSPQALPAPDTRPTL